MFSWKALCPVDRWMDKMALATVLVTHCDGSWSLWYSGRRKDPKWSHPGKREEMTSRVRNDQTGLVVWWRLVWNSSSVVEVTFSSHFSSQKACGRRKEEVDIIHGWQSHGLLNPTACQENGNMNNFGICGIVLIRPFCHLQHKLSMITFLCLTFAVFISKVATGLVLQVHKLKITSILACSELPTKKKGLTLSSVITSTHYLCAPKREHGTPSRITIDN